MTSVLEIGLPGIAVPPGWTFRIYLHAVRFRINISDWRLGSTSPLEIWANGLECRTLLPIRLVMHLSVEGLRPRNWSYPPLQYLREWPTPTFFVTETVVVRHCGLLGSAPAWDGTGCEFDSWQCRIYIPCALSLYDYLGPCGVLWVHIAWHNNCVKKVKHKLTKSVVTEDRLSQRIGCHRWSVVIGDRWLQSFDLTEDLYHGVITWSQNTGGHKGSVFTDDRWTQSIGITHDRWPIFTEDR